MGKNMRVSLTELNSWLKKTGITRKDVAQMCNINRSAVDGWFYRGEIPKTASAILKQMMNRHPDEKSFYESAPVNTIVLKLTSEQFMDWSKAALANGKILTEWILDTIEMNKTRRDQNEVNSSAKTSINPVLKSRAEDVKALDKLEQAGQKLRKNMARKNKDIA